MNGNRAGKLAIILGIVLMVGGLIVGLASVVVAGNQLGPALQSAFIDPPLIAPGTATANLSPGTWSVYSANATAASPGGSGTTSATFRTVQARSGLSTFDVKVTGPDGKQLVLQDATAVGTDTITRKGITYTAALSFSVKQSGEYHLVVANNEGLQLIIAPSIRNLGHFLPWGALAGVGLGGVALLAGVLILVVGAVSTSRSRSAAQAAPSLPPAGWYPDPMRSANWRYWDGQGWTAHIG